MSFSNVSKTLSPVALAAAGLLSMHGCRREEGVVHETIVRPAATAAPEGLPRFRRAPVEPGADMPAGHPPVGESGTGAAAPAMGAPAGMAGDVPPPPPVEKGAGLHWTLPAGWTESRTGGMRYATLKPAGDAKVDVSVVVLGGPAGGELANVNRWRGQLGLAPVDEAALPSLKRVFPTKAGDVALFSFDSADKQGRMLVGYLVAGDSSWFVKMTGEGAAVGAASDEFAKLLKTLSFE
ncbi:MAG: hypothetical protein RL199_1866 [Pseudomonadota bacterium]|jgi:hypothetical protein